MERLPGYAGMSLWRESGVSLSDLQTRWQLHSEKFFSCFKAVQVTSGSISQFVDSRQAEGASNATINRELSLLRQLFKKGTEADPQKSFASLRSKCFLRAVLAWVFSARRRRKVTRLGRQARAMVPNFSPDGSRYGWRKDSELLSLRVQQVDLRAGKIRLAPGTTKSGEGREVPISGSIEMLVRACVEGKTPDDHVFTYPDGAPVKDFRGLWAKAAIASGVGIWTCRACYQEAKLPIKGVSIKDDAAGSRALLYGRGRSLSKMQADCAPEKATAGGSHPT